MKTIFTSFLILVAFTNVNAQTWVQALNGRSVWSLAKDNNGNIYAGGLTNANSRIWKSTNGGSTWDTLYIGSGQTMWGFGFDGSGNMYVANYSTGLLKSTNGGADFTVISTTNFGGNQVQNVVCGPGNYVYAATPQGFYASSNSGISFSGPALTGLNCLPIAVDKDSANIVYVGVSGGTSGQGFYRSTDFGATFSANLNAGKNGYNIFQKANGTLYMITTTSPYNFDKSTNKGLTWTTQGNVTQGAMRGITVDAAGNIFLAGNGGVFKSTNEGASFTNFNLTGSGTPILNVGNKIIAGITGQGVYVYTDSTLAGIENEQGLQPERFTLNQNYPNPFNPETVISYRLANPGFVKLTVYSITGKTIKVLVSERQPAGAYKYNFNGAGLSSGIYFYKLEAGSLTAIKRMLLVK